MAGSLSFHHLLTPDGVASDRSVVVDDNGRISAVEEAGDGPRDGYFALAGMPNAHSHAFQRALRGHLERPAGEDSFWGWRRAMYRLAARLTPDELYLLARAAFSEMLAAGFTSVAEFHYLHHRPDGAAGPEMADAIVRAAEHAGIRLVLLPVFYRHGGFGQPARREQMRFVHEDVDAFSALLDRIEHADCGVALHSLRAVTPTEIEAVLRVADARLPANAPIHIHVSEQAQEVRDCTQFYGASPVDVLLDQVGLSERWNLVHATHASAAELQRVRASGAGVVLCPLTEGYLGDGVFDAAAYAGGRIAIGSDSNVRIDAVEELRMLEYGQRLRHGARLCLAESGGMGDSLWRRAAEGGGAALGLPVGRIAPGYFADLVVLDGDAGALAGVAPRAVPDALLCGCDARVIRDVYVGGVRVVERGQSRGTPGDDFVALMKRLGETL